MINRIDYKEKQEETKNEVILYDGIPYFKEYICCYLKIRNMT